MTITADYTVTGMTCEHCERSVTEEVEVLAGVTGVTVSAATGFLRIESDHPLEDNAVLGAVDEAGYTAVRSTHPATS